ncbi:MAG: hypothetical protein IJ489_11785 [Clostridia bacterium]|nr:hypothetical protein [Clostridia bacterium]
MKKILHSLLAISLLLLTIGCNKAVYVLSYPEQPTEFFDEEIPPQKTFEIGGKTIDLTYKYSKKYGIFQSDCYFANVDKRYHFDENGNVISIRDNDLFPAIENIESLSEEEIKEAVISLLSNTFDLSVYDTFAFHNNTAYYLRWEISDKTISFDVTVDQTGKIDYISITDQCPDEEPLRIDDKTRDRLLKSAIQKEIKDDFTFEIRSAKQTFDENGNNAMQYAVAVTDQNGFGRGIFIYLIH